ncbi:MAG: methyltransferase domain-containing protein, partial [Planctomycetes bacterium]|nr:methyltransferase domain-containing protein [Planctomycetota bacterium]
AAGDSSASTRDCLRSFLCAYWLRPENALWMTLRSIALKHSGFDRYHADLCCGDGVFSFLHAGGRFHDEFDVFAAVAHLDRVIGGHADMFDCPAAEYAPPLARAVRPAIPLGADLKPNLLHKARQLGLYAETRQIDGNKRLPLEAGSLRSVYCNSAYWIRRIDSFLQELRRVTQPDGRIILHVKLSAMQDYNLAAHRDQLGERFLSIIGRGRLECWPTVGTRQEWERRFSTAGLEIVDALPFATRTHAHIWDIGLRPLAPLLVRMANAIAPQTRLAIKRDWVALLLDLAEPLCRFDCDLLGKAGEPAEIQYVLRPM